MHDKRDSEIEQWVLRELLLARNLASQEMCVLASDGVVTLSGSVQNGANKSAAEEAVHHVVGVHSIVNNLKIKAHSSEIRKSAMPIALLKPFIPIAPDSTSTDAPSLTRDAMHGI